ncbi:hemerythrin domain-containing protein [Alkalibacillus almallahensis]|uniref:hemerythrin domain-containing protein n=1 Tax=Alkalibacillus almallahensis TaxID=1379154 RepID=UPI001423D2B4|nr:hemerythrin domain-containing protein [Alkalibacillus almallahensis]NIK12045.1 hemerythrin-like domain-containing protein [Alkalibacillus almallahensis]
MKRHESLYPLSHHHHHALVMAVNMTQVGTDKQKHSYREMLRQLIEFWEKDGDQHFHDEETVLIPLYLAYGEEIDHESVKRMLYEHAQVRGYIHQLRHSTRAMTEEMQTLGQLLQDHIRFEERDLFPKVEEQIPEKYLYQANGQFTRDSYSGF